MYLPSYATPPNTLCAAGRVLLVQFRLFWHSMFHMHIPYVCACGADWRTVGRMAVTRHFASQVNERNAISCGESEILCARI